MATVQITFGAAMDGIAPVVAAVPRAAEDITSSGTSQASAITAQRGEKCQITASGGAIWVKFGSAPTASAGNDHLITDGSTREFGFLETGWKVALIDV